jgi:hypothetical protein
MPPSVVPAITPTRARAVCARSRPASRKRGARRGQCVLTDAVEPTGFGGAEVIRGDEARHLAGQRIAEPGGVEGADRTESAATIDQSLPERFRSRAERRNGPAAGDERAARRVIGHGECIGVLADPSRERQASGASAQMNTGPAMPHR